MATRKTVFSQPGRLRDFMIGSKCQLLLLPQVSLRFQWCGFPLTIFLFKPCRGWLWSKINFLLKFSIPLPKLPSGLSFLFRLLSVNSLTLQYRWLLVPFSFTLYSMSFPLPLLKNGFWALIGAK